MERSSDDEQSAAEQVVVVGKKMITTTMTVCRWWFVKCCDGHGVLDWKEGGQDESEFFVEGKSGNGGLPVIR